MELIRRDKYVTTNQLVETVGISARSIAKHIANFKKQGIIERIGGDKGGYWKINVDE